MCMSSRTRLFLAKLEPTEGTDANPVVGTDDVFCLQSSAGIVEGVTTVQVDPASPNGWELPQAVSTRKPTATLSIPFYGLGEAGGGVVNAPAWLRVLLQSCGHVNYNAGAGGGVAITWNPDNIYPLTTAANGTPTAALPTFTLYEFSGRDGSNATGTKVIKKMLGCRVSSITINMTVGQWTTMDVAISGLWVQSDNSTTDISGADLDGAASDFLRPNGAASVLTFPTGPTAVTLKTQSTQWTIDFGGEHIEGDDLSSGVSCIGTDAPRITGTANPILASSQIDLWENAKAAQTQLIYSLGTAMTPQGRSAGAGYTVDFDAPAVQVSGEIDRSQKVMRQAVQLRAVSPNGTTTNPFTLTLT